MEVTESDAEERRAVAAFLTQVIASGFDPELPSIEVVLRGQVFDSTFTLTEAVADGRARAALYFLGEVFDSLTHGFDDAAGMPLEQAQQIVLDLPEALTSDQPLPVVVMAELELNGYRPDRKSQRPSLLEVATAVLVVGLFFLFLSWAYGTVPNGFLD